MTCYLPGDGSPSRDLEQHSRTYDYAYDDVCSGGDDGGGDDVVEDLVYDDDDAHPTI